MPARKMGRRQPADATGAESSDRRPAVRERIASDADNLYPNIKAFFEDALKAERRTWVTCDHCNRRTEVEVPDWNARAKIVETLLNQGFGRPSSGDTDGSGAPFILKRVIVMPDGAEHVTHGETLPPVA
jgi:hypothetical protein